MITIILFFEYLFKYFLTNDIFGQIIKSKYFFDIFLYQNKTLNMIFSKKYQYKKFDDFDNPIKKDRILARHH